MYSPKHFCNFIQLVIDNLFALYTFTDWNYYTLSPNVVKTSRTEFDNYKVCAKNERKVEKAGSLTVDCKATAIRYIVIKRKTPSRTFWSLVICEAVIIGRRTVCKYCGELCYITA